MQDQKLLKQVRLKAQKWLNGNYDHKTKQAIKKMLEADEENLIDSFYRDLEFGTGGLRGVMGPGTNRMNIYTVGMATQGYSNYLIKQFPGKEIKVSIAYDCRNNSRLFAETAAGIFTGNGFQVYLFESLRPTPELSFSIRHFKCQGGVVITASHNPKEYNGFKAYWEDGGQIISPHDKNIIHEVNQIGSVDDVKFNGPKEKIQLIGKKIDQIYTDKIKELSLSPDAIRENSEMKIVYTPLHGAGVNLVPMVLKKFGFKKVTLVPEQAITDGDFPTVISPNPEEHEALKMVIDLAKETNAEIAMGTDPDADRVGIVVKNHRSEYVILNGNQTGSILVHYLLTQWKEKGKLTGKQYVCKTIVTTDLIAKICSKFEVKLYEVLTGFKFIADLIKKQEGKETFIGGGEESYGYLAGEFVRDKDAIMSCALIAEAAAWARSHGQSMYDLLIQIYLTYGFFKESMVYMIRKGKSGAEEINKIMEDFRKNPPKVLNKSKVVTINDYLESRSKDMISGIETIINLPVSNVLQLILQDGSKISIRPSGTEPKIKFYFSVQENLATRDDFEMVEKTLDTKINILQKELGVK